MIPALAIAPYPKITTIKQVIIRGRDIEVKEKNKRNKSGE